MKGGAEPPARKLWMQSSASVALNSRQSFEMRLKDRKKAEQRRAEIHALNRVLARRDAQQFGECLVVVGGSNVYGQAQTVWQYHPQVGVWRKRGKAPAQAYRLRSCWRGPTRATWRPQSDMVASMDNASSDAAERVSGMEG